MHSLGVSCQGISVTSVCRFIMRRTNDIAIVIAIFLRMNLVIALIIAGDQILIQLRFAYNYILKFVMSETQSSYDFEAHNTFFQEQSQNREGDQSSNLSMIQPPMSILQSTFSQLDKEGKGTITKSILKRATMITSDQYDKNIIREEIEKCDQQINYSRFVQIFQMANVGDRGVNQWLFSLYDSNAKGYINSQDLRRVSEITGIELSQQQIQQMLATQRNEGCKKVDYTDFKYIMQQQIQYM